MFVSHTATLDVSFEVAMTRLAALTGSGVLTQVSADAYAAGAPPSVPWLAGSRFRDLITRPGRAVLAVRWETDGHYGEPFPVLDADLTLTRPAPVPPCSSCLASTGPTLVRTALAWARWSSAASWTGSPRRSPARVPAPVRTALGPRSRQGRLFGPSPQCPLTATVSLRCRPRAAPHLVSPGNPSRAEQKGSDP